MERLSGTDQRKDVPGSLPVRIAQRPCRNILGKSKLPGGGFSANPYVGCAHACRYCYATYMSRFTGHQEPWGSYVDVKTWDSIGRPGRLQGESVFLSSATDPYQPAEAEYGRTRLLLEQLQGSGARPVIVTKSALVLRDLELIRSFPDAVVAWSVNTLDEQFRSEMDRADTVGQRLEAMSAFHAAGVRTACFAAPVFPGISDVSAILNSLRGRCDEVWVDKLNLRGPNRKSILRYIELAWPGLLPLYRGIYLAGEQTYWQAFSTELHGLAGSFPGRVISYIGGHGTDAD